MLYARVNSARCVEDEVVFDTLLTAQNDMLKLGVMFNTLLTAQDDVLKLGMMFDTLLRACSLRELLSVIVKFDIFVNSILTAWCDVLESRWE